MNHKLKDSINLIEHLLDSANHERPVVMFSGGKDSVVMLHIIAKVMQLDLPVLFHREPFFHGKYSYAMKMLDDWGLTAHDYPPLGVSLWEGKSIIAYTNHYQVGVINGTQTTLDLPKNIIQPEEGKPYLCGLNDIIKRPTAYFNYPWNLAFIGHKDSDEDQIAGKTHLYANFVENQPAGPDLAFPLRFWLDEDIWNYLDEHGIKVQPDRYDQENRREWTFKDGNGDYFHACIRCINRNGPDKVFCPKLKREIDNVSSSIVYRDLTLPYFGENANSPA